MFVRNGPDDIPLSTFGKKKCWENVLNALKLFMPTKTVIYAINTKKNVQPNAD